MEVNDAKMDGKVSPGAASWVHAAPPQAPPTTPSVWLVGPVARVYSLGLDRSGTSVGDAPGSGGCSAAGSEVPFLSLS